MKNNQTKSKKKKNKKRSGNSKFFEKYNDRIQSIQESENNRNKKLNTIAKESKKKTMVADKKENNIDTNKKIEEGRMLESKMEETLRKMKAINKNK